jgi:hypothetical protein
MSDDHCDNFDRRCAKQVREGRYLILYSPCPSNVSNLDFRVLESTGEYDTGELIFFGEGNQETTNIVEAGLFLEGHIKWDGCSNWYFTKQDYCMLHFCGRSEAIALGKLMDRMYSIANEEIRDFEGNC